MANFLDYDFERPWWGHPIVNGIGGGVASGGGSYAVTENPQISGIVGLIGSIVTGGATYVATKGKVFDKSGKGNTGVLKNGAHIENGMLVTDGFDDYVESTTLGDFGSRMKSFKITAVLRWTEDKPMSVMGSHQPEGKPRQQYLYFDVNRTAGSAPSVGDVAFNVRVYNNMLEVGTSGLNLNDGELHKIECVVRDSSENDASLLVDGEDRTEFARRRGPEAFVNFARPFYVGVSQKGNRPQRGFFKGAMDLLKIEA